MSVWVQVPPRVHKKSDRNLIVGRFLFVRTAIKKAIGNRWLLSERRDSNSRPRPWQGRALPAELLSLKIPVSQRDCKYTPNINFAKKE